MRWRTRLAVVRLGGLQCGTFIREFADQFFVRALIVRADYVAADCVPAPKVGYRARAADFNAARGDEALSLALGVA
ncbi:MAG: hypothetical protein AAB353_01600 [Candidatus Hydrogenedentota bacterium]